MVIRTKTSDDFHSDECVKDIENALEPSTQSTMYECPPMFKNHCKDPKVPALVYNQNNVTSDPVQKRRMEPTTTVMETI